MAEDPQKGPQEPNLELPSLFGRGRKKKQKAAAPEESSVEAPAEGPSDATGAPHDDAPGRPALVPTTGSGRRLPPAPPPSDLPATAPPATQAPAAAPQAAAPPAAAPPSAAAEAPAPASAPAAAAPTARRVPPPRTPTARPTGPAAATTATTGPDFAYDAPERSGATTLTELTELTEPDPGHQSEPVPPKDKKARRRPAMPSLAVGHPLLAAAVAGVVVGLVGVVLLSLVGRACSAVRGVDSCGGGLGLLALLAAAAVEVVLGAVLLKGQQLSDSTSTSFLGVGMVAVVALALFFGALGSAWMFLVLPLLTGVTFVIAFWVTTTFVEDPGS